MDEGVGAERERQGEGGWFGRKPEVDEGEQGIGKEQGVLWQYLDLKDCQERGLFSR